MLEFEPGLFIWTSVSFGLLVLLLYKLALPPILKLLKQREAAIAAALGASEQAKQDAQAAQAASRQKIGEAGETARQIIGQAKAEAEAMRLAGVDRANKEAAYLLQKAREEAQREKDGLTQAVMAQAADLVIAASSKILKQKIDPESDRKIVAEAIKECQI